MFLFINKGLAKGARNWHLIFPTSSCKTDYYQKHTFFDNLETIRFNAVKPSTMGISILAHSEPCIKYDTFGTWVTSWLKKIKVWFLLKLYNYEENLGSPLIYMTHYQIKGGCSVKSIIKTRPRLNLGFKAFKTFFSSSRILNHIGPYWTIVTSCLFGPINFDLSIWNPLFWPVYFDRSTWTLLFGPIFFGPFVLIRLFWSVYLDPSICTRLFLPVPLHLSFWNRLFGPIFLDLSF